MCVEVARRLTWPGVVAYFVLGVAILVTPACGDGPSSPSDLPNLTILLTDDITDDVQQVDIYFTSVTAKPVGQPLQTLNLELTDNPVDLLTLSDRVVMLAAGVVDFGAYEFIQVNVDEDRSSVVEEGVRKPLQVPSEEVKILGAFDIDDDHETTITLDFDVDESLVEIGSGGWLLQPVIVITGNNTSSR